MPAAYVDFLGIGGSAPVVYAPGAEPNPHNPGGISNNALAKLNAVAEAKKSAAKQSAALAEYHRQQGIRMVAEQRAALEAARKRSGGLLGDIKRLGTATAAVVGTAAAIVGTGGAAAGAIGLGAGLAGITAAAATTSKVLGAVKAGGQVVSSVQAGNIGKAAGQLVSGAGSLGVPAPAAAKDAIRAAAPVVAAVRTNINAAVSAAQGATDMAGLSLNVGKALKSAASGTVKLPAAPKITIPKVSAVKLATAAVAATKTNVAAKAVAAVAAAKTSAVKQALTKTLGTVAIAGAVVGAKKAPIIGTPIKAATPAKASATPVLPSAKQLAAGGSSAVLRPALATSIKPPTATSSTKTAPPAETTSAGSGAGFFVFTTGAKRGQIEFRAS